MSHAKFAVVTEAGSKLKTYTSLGSYFEKWVPLRPNYRAKVDDVVAVDDNGTRHISNCLGLTESIRCSCVESCLDPSFVTIWFLLRHIFQAGYD